jgi:hypothetical protein
MPQFVLVRSLQLSEEKKQHEVWTGHLHNAAIGVRKNCWKGQTWIPQRNHGLPLYSCFQQADGGYGVGSSPRPLALLVALDAVMRLGLLHCTKPLSLVQANV